MPLRRSQLDKILADKCYPSEEPSELVLKFCIAGSTGNIYKVKLDYRPTCTCPDFEKRKDVCKHIMYTLVKVVGLPETSKLVYQKAFLSTELDEIHRRMANHSSNASRKAATSTKAKSSAIKNPRCHKCKSSILHQAPVICPDCRSTFHEACLEILPSFDRLNLSNNSTRKHQTKTTLVECPCCLVDFHHDEGYENIAHETGQSRLRDHSTYRPTPGYPGYTPPRKQQFF